MSYLGFLGLGLINDLPLKEALRLLHKDQPPVGRHHSVNQTPRSQGIENIKIKGD